MSAAAERVIATARAEIGYREKASNQNLDSKTANAGGANYTKYARDLDVLGDVYNGRKNGYDWCDVFVDWCFITTFGEKIAVQMLYQPYKGCGAGCEWSRKYYAAKNQYFTKGPKPGDQIFFDWSGAKKAAGHTGIVVAVGGNTVTTVEGNTGNNATQVLQKSYNVNSRYIMGYGRPNWALAQITPAQPKPTPSTPPKEDDEMLTYEQFKEYLNRYRKEVQSKPGSGWSEADRNWAVQNGLFQGGSDEALMWQDTLTREQAAALFHREAERTGRA